MENDLNDFLNDGGQSQEQQDESVFSNRREDPFNEFLDEGESQDEEGDEEGEEGAKPSKKTAFHEDQKLQRYIDRQVKKRMGEQAPVQQTQQVQSQPQEDRVTDVFTRLIGNDTAEKVAIVKELKQTFDEYGQAASENAYQRFVQAQQATAQEEAEALEELEDSFDTIEDTFNVDLSSPASKKFRNDFIDFLEKVSPKDKTTGEIIAFADPITTFETFQNLKKGKIQPSRARQISSRSMSRSTPVTQKPAGGNSWGDVDRMIENLG